VKHRTLKSWTIPLLILIILCLILSLTTFWIDKQIDGKAINAWICHLFSENPSTLSNILGGLTQVTPAILAITITVIAIIVELASTKYSPKVMDLFVNDPLNFWVMALFVVASVNSIWVAHILTESFFPMISILINAFLACISLLLVIPYFNHVFTFLHPHNFINYVEDKTIADIENIAQGKQTEKKIDILKKRALDNIEFIGDIAINSVIQGDRAVTQFSCDVLTDMLLSYSEIKAKLPEHFFDFSKLEKEDPDFIDFSSFVLGTIKDRRIWMERKIFRMMEVVFSIACDNLKTVASGILLNTGKIGKRAIERNDKDVIFTVIQYFNTFIRFAINKNDPKTAISILEHYRNFGVLLMEKMPAEAERIVFYFKYYALEAQKRQVYFILETAACDICRLIEIAYTLQIPSQQALLEQFLKLDQPIDESDEGTISQQEKSLIGVRIAQTKLAGFYIINGRDDLARIIYTDMLVEPLKRIHQIQEIIELNKNEDFYEISGRGVNIYYITSERRKALEKFFLWFEEKQQTAEAKISEEK